MSAWENVQEQRDIGESGRPHIVVSVSRNGNTAAHRSHRLRRQRLGTITSAMSNSGQMT